MKLRFVRRMMVLLILPGVGSILTLPAEAKIAPIPFDQLVANADFVGIVECETAGAIVAKYKVIESCRGAKAGEIISIRSYVRGPGPQYFSALCGQRYLMLATIATPGAAPAGRPMASIPLAWRRLHADYEFAYGRGPSTAEADRYQLAQKLVAARPKAEAARVKPGPEIFWKGPLFQRPEQAQLDAWRATLRQAPSPLNRDELDKARDGLLTYDPAPFFDEMAAWTTDKLGRTDIVYDKASRLAWRCGQDREKHLKSLLNAKEPIARVAGAVYLCFENEPLGLRELEKLTKLSDEAGAWAALTLARRGKKDAIPRLLQLFADRHRSVMQGGSSFETGLRLNALVLLSNSAKKSNLPQPPNARWGEVGFDAIQAWWQANAAKITLHDPWLETLGKQKID